MAKLFNQNTGMWGDAPATLKQISAALKDFEPGNTLSIPGISEEITSSYLESMPNLGGFGWDQIQKEIGYQKKADRWGRLAESAIYGAGKSPDTLYSPYALPLADEFGRPDLKLTDQYWTPLAKKYGINSYPTIGQVSRGSETADQYWDTDEGRKLSDAWEELYLTGPASKDESHAPYIGAGIAMLLSAGAAGGAFAGLGAGAGAGAGGAAGASAAGTTYGIGAGAGGLGFNAGGFLGGASSLGGIGGTGLGFAGTAGNVAGWGLGGVGAAAGAAGGAGGNWWDAPTFDSGSGFDVGMSNNGGNWWDVPVNSSQSPSTNWWDVSTPVNSGNSIPFDYGSGFGADTGWFDTLKNAVDNPLKAIEESLGLPSGSLNTAQKAYSAINTLGGGGNGGSGGGLSGLLGTGAGLLGSYLQGNAASGAADKQSQAYLEAARIAADAAKFRPVGVTTRFGNSQFGYDANGNLNSAGYNLSPDIKAQQDKLLANSNGMLDQYLGAQQSSAPLGVAGQRAMNLGNGYLNADPQAQAQKFYDDQQAIMGTGRSRDYSNLINTLQQQGRMGLATGGTGMMGAANPALEAYYNSIRQQDLELAGKATQGGMDYAKFGAGLAGAGGDLMKQMYGTQTAAFDPYKTSLGGAQTLEGLGQQPFDLGINIGAKGSASGANSGQLLQNGTNRAADIQANAAYSPWAGLLTGAGQQLQGYKFDPLTGRAL